TSHGAVVARRDGTSPDGLRELATAVLAQAGVQAVVLGGSPEGGKVSLVAAVAKGYPLGAPELVAAAASLVGGGGGGRNRELAMAGGRDVSRLDDALAAARERLDHAGATSQTGTSQAGTGETGTGQTGTAQTVTGQTGVGGSRQDGAGQEATSQARAEPEPR
ncbi:MAG: DHHA1 domain-containing protein, partial [Acidimicrobiales bacterium]